MSTYDTLMRGIKKEKPQQEENKLSPTLKTEPYNTEPVLRNAETPERQDAEKDAIPIIDTVGELLGALDGKEDIG